MAKKIREVLIVDDDTTATYLNKRIVREMGITERITTCTNGQDALHYLLNIRSNDNSKAYPELIILDHHMPVMNGLELMQELNEKKMLEEMRTVVLVLAIHTKADELRRFSKLGVQEFTDKPLSKQTLTDAYRKYWANDTASDHNQG